MEMGIKLYLDGKEVKSGSRQLTVNEEYRSFFGIMEQVPAQIETHLEVTGTWTDLEDGHVTGTLFGVPFTAHVVSKIYCPGVVGIRAGFDVSTRRQMDFTLLVVFGVNTCTQHK
ncbi:hypothetical protein [Vibrio phage vB_VpaS_AL-2]|nr:hypothetical protein [Vibrio phage vB_VpaS_AL-2]